MKISQCLVLALVLSSVACAGVKTRKEAAEDAKLKTIYSINNQPAGPIEEEDESGESSPATAAADDKVLNDELAAMGIDPSNPDGRKAEGTPEPEVHGNVIPAGDIEPQQRIAPRKAAPKAAAKAKPKKAAPKKKPVKKTKKKPVTE